MKKIIVCIVSLVTVFSLFTVSLSMGAGSLTVGNDASVRPITDTYHNFAIIDTNNPASSFGKLTAFDYYASNLNPFHFVLIDGSNVVKWISDEITPDIIGANTYTPSVFVYTGWNLGVYFTLTGTVPFEYTGYTGAPALYMPNNSGIPVVGSTLTYQGSSNRIYSFVATGVALPYGNIVFPTIDEIVFGETELVATYNDGEDVNDDAVSWAVRKDTCNAATNTVFGNVDGHSDSYTWDGKDFSATIDTSTVESGRYCFVFNPKDDAGQTDVRETRWFYIADGYVHGGGHALEEIGSKRKDWYDVSFGGWIAKVGPDLVGEWQVNLHNVYNDNNASLDKGKFHTTEFTSLNFYDGNGNTCNDAVNFTALGTWNREDGYKMIFRAGDNGSPKNVDTVRVTLYSPDATVLYDTHWDDEFTDESNCVGTARTSLDTGNITIYNP